MVLEPWITPSLFYQFLGGDETAVAMDHYSFCRVLGPEEGNKQLRRHWESWVTEDILRELKDSGAVNSLRVPVGDFMFQPYGPYGKFHLMCCWSQCYAFVSGFLLVFGRANCIEIRMNLHGKRCVGLQCRLMR